MYIIPQGIIMILNVKDYFSTVYKLSNRKTNWEMNTGDDSVVSTNPNKMLYIQLNKKGAVHCKLGAR